MWKTKIFDERDNSVRDINREDAFDAGGCWATDTTTITTLRVYMKAHNIPDNAIIRYAGCGSHSIEFHWDDLTDDGSTIR